MVSNNENKFEQMFYMFYAVCMSFVVYVIVIPLFVRLYEEIINEL